MQFTDKQFISHHQRHGLLPIYLLPGELSLLKQELIAAIRKAARNALFEQQELFFIEGHSDWSKVQTALNNLSLFTNKTLFQIHNPKSKFDLFSVDLLNTYLTKPSQDRCIILVTETLTLAARKTPWYQLIDEYGAIITTSTVSAKDLPHWISERLKQKELHADPESIQLLAELTEGNLFATQQAIDKLQLLYPKQSITHEAITHVVHHHAQFTPFDLSHHALNGDTHNVNRVLYHLRVTGTELPLILWAVTRELRNLHSLAYEKNYRDPAKSATNAYGNSRQFILEKALRRLSLEKISILLQQTKKIDQMIKGLDHGNPWHELERLCLSIAGDHLIKYEPAT